MLLVAVFEGIEPWAACSLAKAKELSTGRNYPAGSRHSHRLVLGYLRKCTRIDDSCQRLMAPAALQLPTAPGDPGLERRGDSSDPTRTWDDR